MKMLRYGFLFSFVAACFGGQAAFAKPCLPGETDIWTGTDRNNVDELLFFIKSFPNGCFIDLAMIRLEAVLPTKPTLEVTALANPNSWTGGNDVSVGDPAQRRALNVITLKIERPNGMPTVDDLHFVFNCDAGGVGLIGPIDESHECKGKTLSDFVQGISLNLQGQHAKYYTIQYSCSTARPGPSDQQTHGPMPSGWCGYHAGNGQVWLTDLHVKVSRRDIVTQ